MIEQGARGPAEARLVEAAQQQQQAADRAENLRVVVIDAADVELEERAGGGQRKAEGEKGGERTGLALGFADDDPGQRREHDERPYDARRELGAVRPEDPAEHRDQHRKRQVDEARPGGQQRVGDAHAPQRHVVPGRAGHELAHLDQTCRVVRIAEGREQAPGVGKVVAQAEEHGGGDAPRQA